MKIQMAKSWARRWCFTITALAMVGAGAWLGGCLETTTPSEGGLVGDEIYLLVGINLAIFLGFMAIYAAMDVRSRRERARGLNVNLKPGGAQKPPPQGNVPEDARVCGVCHAANPPHQKFCVECGFRL